MDIHEVLDVESIDFFQGGVERSRSSTLQNRSTVVYDRSGILLYLPYGTIGLFSFQIVIDCPFNLCPLKSIRTETKTTLYAGPDGNLVFKPYVV